MTRNSQSEDLSYALALIDALAQAMTLSTRMPQDKLCQYVSYGSFARQYNKIVKMVENRTDIPCIDVFNLGEIPSPTSALISQHKVYFDAVYVQVLSLQALLANKIGRRTGGMSDIENFIRARLRAAVHTEPACEKDIQDVIDTLFIGRDMQKDVDYGRETGAVNVSLKKAIPDFVVHRLSLAIEVKFIKEPKRIGQVIEEMSADVTQYAVRYSQIIFVVYDMGHIQDERQFCQGLVGRANASVRIVVVKH